MRARRGGQILVVDVDTVFLQTLIPELEKSGHEVLVCGTMIKAQSHLSNESYDVILCAEELPDGTGQELCWWVKETFEHFHLQNVSFALLFTKAYPHSGPETKPHGESRPLAAADSLLNAISSGSHQKDLGPVSEIGLSRPAHFAEGCPADNTIWKRAAVADILLQVESLLRMRRYLQEITNSLAALMAVAEGAEEQDARASGHCKRLAIMSIELGAVMGCEDWQISALERGAYLHDIGKVIIPGALLYKSESLSPREMEIIRSHCALGEKLCQPLAALKPVLPIIRHHHERVNGTGYPDGLHGEDIPVLAQILTIIDIYDSLRTWRPYRGPMPEAPAIAIMHQEVRQGFWDAHIFDAFVLNVLPGLEERLNSCQALWPSPPY